MGFRGLGLLGVYIRGLNWGLRGFGFEGALLVGLLESVLGAGATVRSSPCSGQEETKRVYDGGVFASCRPVTSSAILCL